MIFAGMLLFACEKPADPLAHVQAPAGFTDISREAGLDFVHEAGIDGAYFMAESTGAGVALFDHDADGDLDIYLINGGTHPGPAENPAINRMFSQELGGRFADRTVESGLGDSGYGMGVALGDIDNDGDLDR